MVRGDCNQDTLLIEGKERLCAGKINVIWRCYLVSCMGNLSFESSKAFIGDEKLLRTWKKEDDCGHVK